jgi:hypothetical protein
MTKSSFLPNASMCFTLLAGPITDSTGIKSAHLAEDLFEIRYMYPEKFVNSSDLINICFKSKK